MPIDITYKVAQDDKQHHFNYRVAAVIEANGKVLIHKFLQADFCFLPGGRVQMGETAQDALIRELQEELGIAAQLSGFPFIVENLFQYGGEKFHELCLFFKVDGNDLQLPEHEEIRGNVQFLWHDPSALSGLNLKPAFLKSALSNLPEFTEHIVNLGSD